MKHGKKPTVSQMLWMQSHGLNAKEWLVVKWSPSEVLLENRLTGEIRSHDPRD